MAKRSDKRKCGDKYSCEGRCPTHMRYCPNIRRERKEADRSARRAADKAEVEEQQED